jgi:hypothetical protein
MHALEIHPAIRRAGVALACAALAAAAAPVASAAPPIPKPQTKPKLKKPLEDGAPGPSETGIYDSGYNCGGCSGSSAHWSHDLGRPVTAEEAADWDNDGLMTIVEEEGKAKWTDPVTKAEIKVTFSPTDPHRRDTDRDQLSDGYEVRNARRELPGRRTSGGSLRWLFTSPTRADTDHDTLLDGEEVNGSWHTHPNYADTDNDRLTDWKELKLRTVPTDADSDDDCRSDGAEVAEGSDPRSNRSPAVNACLVDIVSGPARPLP